MTNSEVEIAASIAHNINTLGVTGILALMCMLFIYLYIKEIKAMQSEISKISNHIERLLSVHIELQKKCLQELLKKSLKKEEEDI